MGRSAPEGDGLDDPTVFVVQDKVEALPLVLRHGVSHAFGEPGNQLLGLPEELRDVVRGIAEPGKVQPIGVRGRWALRGQPRHFHIRCRAPHASGLGDALILQGEGHQAGFPR